MHSYCLLFVYSWLGVQGRPEGAPGGSEQEASESIQSKVFTGYTLRRIHWVFRSPLEESVITDD